MADKSTEKERMFNEWFTKSYNRLRTSLRKYGIPDEDNFHDTYLFVRKQVMAPGKDITDYEAYFIGCYKKAVEKPLNFDPFGHARFAHLFVLYD